MQELWKFKISQLTLKNQALQKPSDRKKFFDDNNEELFNFNCLIDCWWFQNLLKN